MKPIHKTAALLMAAAMALSLAACGDKAEPSQSPSSQSDSSSSYPIADMTPQAPSSSAPEELVSAAPDMLSYVSENIPEEYKSSSYFAVQSSIESGRMIISVTLDLGEKGSMTDDEIGGKIERESVRLAEEALSNPPVSADYTFRFVLDGQEIASVIKPYDNTYYYKTVGGEVTEFTPQTDLASVDPASTEGAPAA
ncbi:hypothetical protein H8711_04575 [Clostridiaceae bacterium NSJ-31]|uniref:Lipoprotein n=1 Tax=Ligaoa zhengdingensis TaxID=2763658 RepID=A0A926DZT1_9FIRM|nr:hypothetical protein [Ligaoa zhengdingensis]MBC8546210.1 hypothetical protein [Ligaoa zhengdingensis]